jgi:hypothetical protein
VNLETLGLQHPNNRHWAEFNKFKKDLANVVKLRSVSILGIQICIKNHMMLSLIISLSHMVGVSLI